MIAFIKLTIVFGGGKKYTALLTASILLTSMLTKAKSSIIPNNSSLPQNRDGFHSAAKLYLSDYVKLNIGNFIPSIFLNESVSTLAALPDDALHLLSVVTSQHSKSCLRVGVGVDWNDGDSHVTVQDDTQGRSMLANFKDTTIAINSMNCIMLLLAEPPSSQLLTAISIHGTAEMFFLVFFNSIEQMTKFLLDPAMANEERVLAIIFHRKAWKVYIRLLYTPQGKPEIRKVLSWKPANPINFSSSPFPEQMRNFYGTKFQVTTLDFRPFTDYTVQKGTRVVVESPCLDFYILHEIANNLNFTYDVVTPADGMWGTRFPNGTWTGVVGEVQFRKTNLSLVLSLTYERTLIVDFTRMYFIDPLTYVTAKSRPVPQWQKVFEPFSNSVWTLILFTIGGCVLLFHTMSGADHSGVPVSWVHSSVALFGSFFAQPLREKPEMPSSLSKQVFLLVWCIYVFLVTTYYKSILTAVVVIPSTPPTLDTLVQLLNSDLGYGMIDAKGSEYQLFSTSDVEIYKKLFQKMAFYSSAESMKKVSEGHYAYIYFETNIQSIVSTEFTDRSGQSSLHVAGEKFFPGGYAWAFPKGVPYRRTFDQVMWRCVQAGLVKKWVDDLSKIYWLEKRHHIAPENKQKEAEDAKNKPNEDLIILGMSHLQGVFIALVIGASCSITCFAAEVLRYRITLFRTKEQGRITAVTPTTLHSS